jgi:hypothetical protein
MVRGRVAIRGVVAAADVTTGEADPQVQPLAAVAQAVLAAPDLGWQLAHDDFAEVRAGGVAHVTPLLIAGARSAR